MNRISVLAAFGLFSILSSACSSGAPTSDVQTSAADLSAQRTQHCYSNSDCGSASFCDTESSGTCGGEGVCTSRGTGICSDLDVLACGCDGNPYPNACFAHKAGSSVDAQPFSDTSIKGATLTAQSWVDSTQVYTYTFASKTTGRGASGTVQVQIHPSCENSDPHCDIEVAPKNGTFATYGSMIAITYDDGSSATLEAQTDCYPRWRLAGEDFGAALTLAATAAQ
jgi:hypothetical protein